MMSDLTYFNISFTHANGLPVAGELRAFLPKPVVMPDGSLVQPHQITYPLVNGVPKMLDGTSARIIASAVSIPSVRIPFILVDTDTGKQTDLGDALIPSSDAPVQLAALLRGALP